MSDPDPQPHETTSPVHPTADIPHIEPSDPPSQPGLLRRNLGIAVAYSVAIIAMVIAVVAVATRPSGSAAAVAPVPIASAPSTASPTPTHTDTKPAAHGTRGAIVSDAGSAWSVRTAQGQTITVTITAQTQFGTVKAPATASEFTTGSNVIIAGTVSNGAVTATRVAIAKPAAKSTASTIATS